MVEMQGLDQTEPNKTMYGKPNTVTDVHTLEFYATHTHITAAYKQGERLSNNPYPCWDFQNDLCPQINVHTRNERFADIVATLKPCPNHIVVTCSTQILTILNGKAHTKHWNNDRIQNESAKCCLKKKRENKVRTVGHLFGAS